MDEKKKNNIGILIIILVCIAVLLLVVGLLFKFNSNGEKPKEDPEDKRKQEEKLAKSILTSLNVDDYLGVVFNPAIELNKNILDVGSNQNMLMYFYANDNLNKYKMYAYDTDIVYAIAKYDDYAREHRRVFGIEPDMTSDYDMGASLTFGIANLPETIEDDFQASTADTISCDVNESNDCFVMLINYMNVSNRAEFYDLRINGNIITGGVKQISPSETGELYLDGKFEFEFEKTGDSYTAKSLIITYVADAYNNVDVLE